jgi:NDP-sugar pyrophosphorylase family protein
MKVAYETVILAGGRATRLAQAGITTPKCLIQFGAVPFLILLLTKLFREGCSRAILVLGHNQQAIMSELNRCGNFKGTVDFVSATGGTAPAVFCGIQSLEKSQDYLCLNSDTILEIDFKSLISLRRTVGADAVFALTSALNVPNQGRVLCDDENRIIEFAEDSHGRLAKHATMKCKRLSNCGCYCFRRNSIDMFLSSCGPSLEKDALPQYVTVNRVFGYQISSDALFLDFGDEKRLTTARSMEQRIAAWYKS